MFIDVYARPGDADLDGDVDLSDFGVLKANFGLYVERWSRGDSDGNYVVDLTDFGILKQRFGTKYF